MWRDLLAGIERDPQTMVLVTAGLALVVVAISWLWRPARNVITIVHEAGHALVALLVGRRLAGIRLHSDTSGLTVTKGKPYGPGMVCTGLAGYIAPSLLGLGFAALLGVDRVTELLLVCAVLLIGVLLVVRNAFGILSVLVTGAVLVVVSRWAPVEVQAPFAHLIMWFLLLGGIRSVGDLQGLRRRGRARDSDADQLARLTGAPGLFWVAAFMMINLGCLVLAVGWLVM
ncbi:M50 family metallopeptidase [Actinophytocola sp.]|uniref:M50 family metallopeptidase n=1 Tax=Actinophytocola sp. TaxID=1872138 RepID=UPI003D6A87CD